MAAGGAAGWVEQAASAQSTTMYAARSGIESDEGMTTRS
jgi:hypothetical protein